MQENAGLKTNVALGYSRRLLTPPSARQVKTKTRTVNATKAVERPSAAALNASLSMGALALKKPYLQYTQAVRQSRADDLPT